MSDPAHPGRTGPAPPADDGGGEAKPREGTPPHGAPPGSGPDRKPVIPRPPSPADLEQISRDQALITDEWTGDQPPAGEPEDKPTGG